MADKQQARGGLETIDIKGKPYVTVAERIKSVTDFEDLDRNRYEIENWERFELDGRHFLTCHIVVGTTGEIDYPTKSGEKIPWKLEGKRYSGTSQISFTGGMVNTTSGYENAETSALGRALAFAGIGLLEGVASADEIHKAEAARQAAPAPRAETKLSQDQVTKLMSLAKNKGLATKEEAIDFINAALLCSDFTKLSPENFEEYKKAVIAAEVVPF